MLLQENGTTKIFIENKANSVSGQFGIYSASASKYALLINTSGNTSLNGGTLTSGAITSSGQLELQASTPSIHFLDTDDNSDGYIQANAGTLAFFADDNNEVSNSIIKFSIDGSEKMRLDSSSRLGIGTTSPAEGLHVVGDIRTAGSTYGIRLDSSNSSGPQLEFGTNSNLDAYGTIGQRSSQFKFTTFNRDFHFNNNGTTNLYIDVSEVAVGINTSSPTSKLNIDTGSDQGIAIFRTGTNANFDAIQFRKSNNSDLNARIGFNDTQLRLDGVNDILFGIGSSFTEKMRLNSTGLGIGTTIPAQKLHIKDTSNPASPNGSVVIEGQRDGTANLLELRARDNSSTSSALPSGQGGIIRMNGFDGSDFEEMAFIGYQAEATVADGDAPSRLIFGTTSDGSGATTEKMRLTSAGRLGLGTTSPATNFHVTDGGTPPTLSGTYLIAATSSSNAGIAINSGNSSASIIALGDTDSQDIGTIRYNHSDNSMRFKVNGNSDVFVINSSGEVNINQSGLVIEHASSPFIQLKDTTQNASFKVYAQNSDVHVTTSSNHPMIFDINNSEKMRLDTSGRLGINTTSPASHLDVNGDITINDRLNSSGDTDTYLQFHAADSFRVVTGGSQRFSVNNTGITVLAQPFIVSAPNSAEMKFFQTTSSTTASKGSIQWFDSGSNSCGTINLKANGAENNSGVMEFYVTAESDELGDDPFGINKMMSITESGVQVHGSLSKSSGSFKIDHPLKPDTHDLVHSFVEGPQADNLYRGTIKLENGKAVIDLDEWFGMTPGTFLALNRDTQAFVSNIDDWDAVRAKMMGSQLVIECQNTTSKASVSWLVVGERQDKEIYASKLTDDNGKIIVEPLKEVVE